MTTKGLDKAFETTKQIITLSTGIVAFTVTFAEKFNVGTEGLQVPLSLKISWILYCASVFCAVWTLMAITGTLNKLDREDSQPETSASNITRPAGLMIFAFVGGLVTTIWAGFQIAG